MSLWCVSAYLHLTFSIFKLQNLVFVQFVDWKLEPVIALQKYMMVNENFIRMLYFHYYRSLILFEANKNLFFMINSNIQCLKMKYKHFHCLDKFDCSYPRQCKDTHSMVDGQRTFPPICISHSCQIISFNRYLIYNVTTVPDHISLARQSWAVLCMLLERFITKYHSKKIAKQSFTNLSTVLLTKLSNVSLLLF